MLALSIEPVQNQIDLVMNKGQGKSLDAIYGKKDSDSSSFAKILSSISDKNSNQKKVEDQAKPKDRVKKTEAKSDDDYSIQASYQKNNSPEKTAVDKPEVQAEEESLEVKETGKVEGSKNFFASFENVEEVAMSVSTKIEPNVLTETEIQNAANFENIDLSVSDEEVELLIEDVSFEELMASANISSDETLPTEVVAAQNASYENPKEFLESITDEKTDGVSNVLSGLEGESAELSKDAELTPDEFVNTDNKKVFDVVDQRTQKNEEVSFKSTEEVQVSVNSETADTMNVTYSLNAMSQQNILSSNDQAASASSSAFQQALNNQVTVNVPDFVKAGQVVLRDNNNGTINLNLKPEALGNVKISLNVSDKVITGQITVHSKEAFEAFKENLDSLKQAFQQSGFENAELTLNLSQSGSQGFLGQQGQEQSSEAFMSARTYGDYASSGESEQSVSPVNYESSSNYQIDVVA